MKFSIQYLLLFMVLIITMMPFGSALLDHKIISPETSKGYPVIIHKDILGQEVQSFKLTEHTASCLIDCSSEQEITLQYDGELIEDIRFINQRGKEVEIPYQLKLKIGTENYEENIPVNEEVCKEKLELNLSLTKECRTVITSYKKVTMERNIYKNYSLDEKLPKGTYNLLIIGEKRSKDDIDWIIKSNNLWNDEMAVWNSSFEVDLTAYYALDSNTWINPIPADFGTNDMIDSCGGHCGVVLGKRGKAIQINPTGVVAYNQLNITTSFFTTGISTISFWFNKSSGSCGSSYSQDIIYGSGAAASEAQDLGFNYRCSDNKIDLMAGPSAWTLNAQTTHTISRDVWHNVVLQFNSTNSRAYIDNVLEISSGTGMGINHNAKNFFFNGMTTDTGQKPTKNLSIDEIAVWNRTLSEAEITDLYNSGTGIFYTLTVYPDVTLNSPDDNYNTTNPSIAFNCTGGYDGGVENLTLIIDDADNYTITGGEGLNLSLQTDLTLSEGVHNWTCKATSVDNTIKTATARNLNIDSVAPLLEIIYPTAGNYNADIIELNYTIDDLNNDTCWYSLDLGATNTTTTCDGNITDTITSTEGSNTWKVWANDTFGNENSSSVTFFVDTVYPLIDYGIGTEADSTYFARDWIYMNVTLDESNFENITYSIDGATASKVTYPTAILDHNFTSLADGLYFYNVTSCDVVGNCNRTATRNITLDNSVPSIAGILWPTNNLILRDDTAGFDINFTADDTYGLFECRYKIDDAIWTLLTCNENLTANDFAVGDHNIRFEAVDLTGNSNTTQINFTVFDWLDNSFTEFAVDSGSYLFHKGLNFSSNVTALPFLTYNNTIYTSLTSYNYISGKGYNKTLTIPLINVPSILQPFNWTVNLTYNSNLQTFINTTYNQNVSQFSIGLCDGTRINMTANFTTVDQDTLLNVNESTFKGTIDYYAYSWTYNRTYSFNNYSGEVGEWNFCIFPDYSTIYANIASEYTAIGYDQGSYVASNHLFNANVQNITLYFLNGTISGNTDLVVKVLDGDLVIQKGIYVRMQRYYPGSGTWVEVESDTTDELGQSIFHVIEKEVSYKFILSNATTLLKTTEPIKIVCYSTPCVIELTISADPENQFYNFKPIPGFSYTTSYDNNTQVFEYSFVDTSGVLTGTNFVVKQVNGTSNPVICNTSLTGSSGTMTCNVSLLSGSFIANAYGTFGSKTYLINTISATINNLWKTFGKEGMFWVIIFLISLAMVGIWNPAVSVTMMCIGFVLVSFLGVVSMPYIAIISIIIIGGIVISQLRT